MPGSMACFGGIDRMGGRGPVQVVWCQGVLILGGRETPSARVRLPQSYGRRKKQNYGRRKKQKKPPQHWLEGLEFLKIVTADSMASEAQGGKRGQTSHPPLICCWEPPSADRQPAAYPRFAGDRPWEYISGHGLRYKSGWGGRSDFPLIAPSNGPATRPRGRSQTRG
jgi:hypothetical protein